MIKNYQIKCQIKSIILPCLQHFDKQMMIEMVARAKTIGATRLAIAV